MRVLRAPEEDLAGRKRRKKPEGLVVKLPAADLHRRWVFDRRANPTGSHRLRGGSHTDPREGVETILAIMAPTTFDWSQLFTTHLDDPTFYAHRTDRRLEVERGLKLVPGYHVTPHTLNSEVFISEHSRQSSGGRECREDKDEM